MTKRRREEPPFGESDNEENGEAAAETEELQHPPVFTVTDLTRRIRFLLETEIGEVAVEGEISNWRPAASGHIYFALKDAEASIRCVMFRSAAARLKCSPADGMKVEVRGRLSVYEARGEYQIIVESISEQGLGALFEAFMKLKEKLEKEGLFDPGHKVPLPYLPRRIGVITSPTGAAIRDILNVLGRRFANLSVVIWPVRVQGEGAAAEIARALREMDRRQLADVIICGRGGGSIEDLWAFNEEVVARAIYACRTPVISAVGHEIDFTIADFVADLRAPTPSAAAELVVRNQMELAEKLSVLMRRLDQTVGSHVRYLRSRLEGLLQSYALEQPRAMIEQMHLRLDDLAARLETQVHHTVVLLRRDLEALFRRLGASLRAGSQVVGAAFAERLRRFDRAVRDHLDRVKTHLDTLTGRMEILGPQATLERGYSLVMRRKTGEIVRSPRQVQVNDPLDIHTAGGLFPALATPPVRLQQRDLFAGDVSEK
ncbi:MAG: exodeoxyribonuclease VII large subunit [Candidatus Sumerlaeia bacterium]|nr:exodeoxyribonuclease VII large subunit [Candidatus Sumerlaeia bacterium]